MTDKLYAVGGALGVALGGRWYVASAEASSVLSQWSAAGCIAVCASVATAFWKTRASITKANAEAKASEAATIEAATQALIKRITEANDKHVAQLERDLTYARDRADTLEQILLQERMGKHDALDQLNAFVLHDHTAMEILNIFMEEVRNRGIEVPPSPKVDFARILRGPDAATGKLLSDRDAAKKATVRVEVPAVVRLRPIVISPRIVPQPTPTHTPHDDQTPC